MRLQCFQESCSPGCLLEELQSLSMSAIDHIENLKHWLAWFLPALLCTNWKFSNKDFHLTQLLFELFPFPLWVLLYVDMYLVTPILCEFNLPYLVSVLKTFEFSSLLDPMSSSGSKSLTGYAHVLSNDRISWAESTRIIKPYSRFQRGPMKIQTLWAPSKHFLNSSRLWAMGGLFKIHRPWWRIFS